MQNKKISLKEITYLIYRKTQNLIIYFILFFSFISFFHPDLTGTVLSSQFFNTTNFYSLCNELCTYLPLTYFIFYLWSIPYIYFINPDLTDPTALIIGLEVEPGFFIYNKLLILVIFVISAFLLNKISAILIKDKKKLSAKLFLLSPFSYFVIFIFSGYDIFTLALCLLAIYYYLKNRIFLTFFILSISLSFKFFSILFALSLLAFIKTDISKKFFYLIVLISIPFLQVLLFYSDPLFVKSTLSLIIRNSENTNIVINLSHIVIILYLSWLCLLQFSSRFKKFFEFDNFIFLPYISFLFLFFYSPMQPQWIILILPFTFLIVSKYKIYNAFNLFQILFLFIFIISITNIWAGNIDLNLSNGGFVQSLHDLNYRYMDFYINLKNDKKLFFVFYGSFYLFFLFPFILINKKFIKYFSYLNKINFEYKNLFILGSSLFIIPFVFASFNLKDISQINKEINSSKKLVPLNLRNFDNYLLKENHEICSVMHFHYPNPSFIEIRKILLNGNDINDFSFYLNVNKISQQNIYEDNKSIYIKLDSSTQSTNIICLKNFSKSQKEINILSKKVITDIDNFKSSGIDIFYLSYLYNKVLR